jgi:hypothetical protein
MQIFFSKMLGERDHLVDHGREIVRDDVNCIELVRIKASMVVTRLKKFGVPQ